MFHVKHNVIIIGSGPAGYTAAIYLGRAGLNPVMVTGALSPGGQLVNTTEVENFPGFPEGILGPDLMDRMKEQAKRFGTTYIADDVSSIEACESDSVKPTYRVTLSDDSQLEASSLIIATGSSFRKLGVPGEQELSGHGVSYCATCDGFFFRNKPIVVVGGGDSAFEEALFLTRFGSSVTLIHRRDSFRASQIMVDRAKSQSDHHSDDQHSGDLHYRHLLPHTEHRCTYCHSWLDAQTTGCSTGQCQQHRRT